MSLGNLAMARLPSHYCGYDVNQNGLVTGLRHSVKVDPTKWAHRIYWGYTAQALFSKAFIQLVLNGSIITQIPTRGFFVSGPYDIGLDFDNQQTSSRPFFMFANLGQTFPVIRSSGFDVKLTMDEVRVVFTQVDSSPQTCISGLAVCSS